MSSAFNEGDIVRLLMQGANSPTRGDYFGATGQLARVTRIRTDWELDAIQLLSPRDDQDQGEFSVLPNRLEKL